MGRLFVFGCSLVICAGLSPLAVAAESDAAADSRVDPAGIAILRGVEAARSKIPHGRMSIEAVYKTSGTNNTHKFQLAFLGDKIRLGGSAHLLFDGREVTTF